MRMALAAAAVATVAVAGCSSAADDPGAATPAESSATSPTAESNPSETVSPSPSPTDDSDDAVEIEIEGDRVEPNGRRLEVTAGEPILLEIESDRPAELHVHSRPEQEIEVEPGRSTVKLTIDTPGVVDVEEHESGIIVLQLEVH